MIAFDLQTGRIVTVECQYAVADLRVQRWYLVEEASYSESNFETRFEVLGVSWRACRNPQALPLLVERARHTKNV